MYIERAHRFVFRCSSGPRATLSTTTSVSAFILSFLPIILAITFSKLKEYTNTEHTRA